MSFLQLAESGPFSVPLQCLTRKPVVKLYTPSLDIGSVVLGEKGKGNVVWKNEGAVGVNFTVRRKTSNQNQPQLSKQPSLIPTPPVDRPSSSPALIAHQPNLSIVSLSTALGSVDLTEKLKSLQLEESQNEQIQAQTEQQLEDNTDYRNNAKHFEESKEAVEETTSIDVAQYVSVCSAFFTFSASSFAF